MKRFGGRFNRQKHMNTGNKFMCLDYIVHKKPCIIYSFGINDDLSFETSVSNTIGKNYERVLTFWSKVQGVSK